MFADHPDKPFDGEAGGELMETSVTYNVFEAMRKAQRELVVSAYFVPARTAWSSEGVARQGVKVTWIDQLAGRHRRADGAHGLSQYREPMLEMGVDLYEISSTRDQGTTCEKLFGASSAACTPRWR